MSHLCVLPARRRPRSARRRTGVALAARRWRRATDRPTDRRAHEQPAHSRTTRAAPARSQSEPGRAIFHALPLTLVNALEPVRGRQSDSHSVRLLLGARRQRPTSAGRTSMQRADTKASQSAHRRDLHSVSPAMLSCKRACAPMQGRRRRRMHRIRPGPLPPSPIPLDPAHLIGARRKARPLALIGTTEKPTTMRCEYNRSRSRFRLVISWRSPVGVRCCYCCCYCCCC
jgi:hypothetical protein